MNTVALVGRVERTPHVRFENVGQQVTGFTCRVEEPSRSGSMYKTYIPCECWSALAEQAEALEAGALIAVTGKIGWKSYERQGKKETTLVIMVRSIEVLAAVELSADPSIPVRAHHER